MSSSTTKSNRRELKIMKPFRLRPELVQKLARESKRTNINQTRIVELALAEWFAVKRN